MDKFRTINTNFLIIIVFGIFCIHCSNDTSKKESGNDPLSKFYSGKGIGPVKEIKIGPVDSVIAVEGEKIFRNKCIACHQASATKVIGPGLLGITKRRTPEWIMNQILNPMEMTQKDSLAKELLAVYLTQMVKMDVTESEARKILEFFRANDMKRFAGD